MLENDLADIELEHRRMMEKPDEFYEDLDSYWIIYSFGKKKATPEVVSAAGTKILCQLLGHLGGGGNRATGRTDWIIERMVWHLPLLSLYFNGSVSLKSIAVDFPEKKIVKING